MKVKIDNNFLNLEFKKMSEKIFVKKFNFVEKLRKSLFYCINPK